ncbi:hypothetical protein H4582DRAFT_1971912 [Lactarius indigo]|nr:hypothetical protein H4582DRAFT_1971912 [Lactarius indigo]
MGLCPLLSSLALCTPLPCLCIPHMVEGVSPCRPEAHLVSNPLIRDRGSVPCPCSLQALQPSEVRREGRSHHWGRELRSHTAGG